MILSSVELHAALDSGRLVITPEPMPRQRGVANPNEYCPYDTHAVDLRLGPDITIPEPGSLAFDLHQPTDQPGFIPLAQCIERNSRTKNLTDADPAFTLEKGRFILAQTLEEVSLPIDHPLNQASKSCLAARIEGKSSRARVGLLIHFTAPTVHPGWKGRLTLEMINLGAMPIILRKNMPIAQLIVEEVRGLPLPKPSQFQNQQTPAGVKTGN